jgi:glycosyltransferase involved in cell wall biosynthesis
MNVLVTITTYNEESNIGDVLRHMPDNYDVLVADDGSSYKTVEICRKFGSRALSTQ